MISLIGFLAVALLAGTIVGAGAWRLGRTESLSLAALLFLAQLGAFVLLCGLGLPASAAQGAALAVGLVAVAGS